MPLKFAAGVKVHVPSPLFATSVPLPAVNATDATVSGVPSTSTAFANKSAAVITSAPLSSAIGFSVTGDVVGKSATGVTPRLAVPAMVSPPELMEYPNVTVPLKIRHRRERPRAIAVVRQRATARRAGDGHPGQRQRGAIHIDRIAKQLRRRDDQRATVFRNRAERDVRRRRQIRDRGHAQARRAGDGASADVIEYANVTAPLKLAAA